MKVNGKFEFVSADIGKASKKNPANTFNMIRLNQDYNSLYTFFDDELIPVVEKLKQGQAIIAELDFIVSQNYNSCKLLGVVNP